LGLRVGEPVIEGAASVPRAKCFTCSVMTKSGPKLVLPGRDESGWGEDKIPNHP